jgi:hypothetical protein
MPFQANHKPNMLRQKEYMCKKISRKKLTKKTLWTFEWPKISHILISPYHNHFKVNFIFNFLNMYIEKLFRMFILHMNFLVH